MNFERFQAIIARHTLVYGVIAALLVTILLTTISMALYISSGASRLDLSRPGYERVRTQAGADPQEDTFSSTGPMSSSVTTQFQNKFNKHRNALTKLDTFSSAALNDDELQIAPDPTTAE